MRCWCWIALWMVASTAVAQTTEEAAAAPQMNAVLQPYREAAVGRWEVDIQKLESLDADLPANDDAILFIGSSSIRRWDTIAQDMAPYEVIQRGYGGAKYTDLAVFAERLIQPHRYRAVVVFVANDVVGKPSDRSLEELEPLVRHIVDVSHQHNPDAPVLLTEITPTQSRFAAWKQIRQVNALLREIALTTPNTYFIATAEQMLTRDGQPRPELFVEDQLHLNQDGYQLWSKLIRQKLDEVLSREE